jgi:2-amino-4-hydroxy-6-hydroxymethyldihydropteridine diphosphokinase
MTTAYLGLGSNQGNRARHLQRGVDEVHRHEGVFVTAVSPVYETEAHTVQPNETQPAYLNAVVAVETTRSPEALLRVAQAAERAEGRTRPAPRWSPRPLDVDLLAVGAEQRATPTLTLPHPRLADRRFVLRPWADLAPNFQVPPPFDRPVRALLAACPDPGPLAPSPAMLAVPPP